MNSRVRRLSVAGLFIGMISCGLHAQVAVRQTVAESMLVWGFSRWNANTLVSYVGTENRMKSPAVAIMQEGSGRSTQISVLKDFPEAISAQIADADATPDGGAVLAVILVMSPASAGKQADLKSLILSYDASGMLSKVWDASPYEFDAIAVDKNGNVYGLGERTDKGDSERYPLLIEYSRDGSILHEFLQRTLFSPGVYPTESNYHVGRPSLSISGDGNIFVYTATTGELFSILPDGSGLKRMHLASFLQTKSEFRGAERMEVMSLIGERHGSVLANALVVREGQARAHLITIDKGLNRAEVAFSGRQPGQLLSVDADGNLVFLGATSDANRTIGHYIRSSFITGSSITGSSLTGSSH